MELICDFNESVLALHAVCNTELISRYTFERTENSLRSGGREFSSRTYMNMHHNVHSTSAGEVAFTSFTYINVPMNKYM